MGTDKNIKLHIVTDIKTHNIHGGKMGEVRSLCKDDVTPNISLQAC